MAPETGIHPPNSPSPSLIRFFFPFFCALWVAFNFLEAGAELFAEILNRFAARFRLCIVE
jgi:hypothetical protein